MAGMASLTNPVENPNAKLNMTVTSRENVSIDVISSFVLSSVIKSFLMIAQTFFKAFRSVFRSIGNIYYNIYR
jgi:hypothetical protein